MIGPCNALRIALLAAYGVLDRVPIEDADPDADRDGQDDPQRATHHRGAAGGVPRPTQLPVLSR